MLLLFRSEMSNGEWERARMSLRDHDVNHGFRARAVAAAIKVSEKARRYFGFPAKSGMRRVLFSDVCKPHGISCHVGIAQQTYRRYREPVKSPLALFISRLFDVRQNVCPDPRDSPVFV